MLHYIQRDWDFLARRVWICTRSAFPSRVNLLWELANYELHYRFTEERERHGKKLPRILIERRCAPPRNIEAKMLISFRLTQRGACWNAGRMKVICERPIETSRFNIFNDGKFVKGQFLSVRAPKQVFRSLKRGSSVVAKTPPPLVNIHMRPENRWTQTPHWLKLSQKYGTLCETAPSAGTILSCPFPVRQQKILEESSSRRWEDSPSTKDLSPTGEIFLDSFQYIELTKKETITWEKQFRDHTSWMDFWADLLWELVSKEREVRHSSTPRSTLPQELLFRQSYNLASSPYLCHVFENG